MKRYWILAALCLLLISCAKPESAEPMPTKTEPVTEVVTAAPTQLPTEAPTEMPTQIPTELPTEPEDDELVRVIDYLPSVREELAYATGDNFTGQQIYDFYNAYLR